MSRSKRRWNGFAATIERLTRRGLQGLPNVTVPFKFKGFELAAP